MKNTRLESLLNTFSSKELRAFQTWVNSPFFNKREDVKDLLGVCRMYRQRQQKTPTKQVVYARIFFNEPYDDQRLRLVISRLNRLAEQFLVYQTQQQNSAQQQIELCRIYRERQLDRHFHSALRKAEAHIKASSHRSTSYFAQLHDIHFERYRYHAAHYKDRVYPIDQIAQSLDGYFVLQKLRQVVMAGRHELVFNVSYELGLSPLVLEQLENDPALMEQPVIKLYYCAFQSLKDRWSTDKYFRFKDELLRHASFLPKHEQRNLILAAIGICGVHYNYGKRTAFAPEIQLLHEYALGHQLFQELDVYMFKDIVSIGLANGKFAWVEQFIVERNVLVHQRQRETIIQFSWGNVALEREDYAAALTHFHQVNFENIFLATVTKVYSTIALYHLGEWDVASSYISALEVFVRKKKNFTYHRDLILRWAKYTRRLMALQPYDNAARIKLLAEVQADDNIGMRWWLLTQLE